EADDAPVKVYGPIEIRRRQRHMPESPYAHDPRLPSLFPAVYGTRILDIGYDLCAETNFRPISGSSFIVSYGFGTTASVFARAVQAMNLAKPPSTTRV